ncbi:hypothetical protein BJQ94_13030 [Cryobacterium sp. SO2]|uniref:hypothetical protein n=1 Tax=Cryobacterium sp. SO2 TaxID=1897060 RepID=UPI00223D4F76|nr:hypothetical protein [Cryobacterium sp. SO2]WEO76281.1 hypothetical protein BJQ94_13030 [Cryobacterium sp. SO2]
MEEGTTLAAELGPARRYVHLDVTHAQHWDAAVAEAVEPSSACVALHRVGRDVEVANLVLFLASDASSFSTAPSSSPTAAS